MQGESQPKFNTSELVANTAIASIGTGAAVVAASGLIWPALIGAAAGGLIGYTITNQIPRK